MAHSSVHSCSKWNCRLCWRCHCRQFRWQRAKSGHGRRIKVGPRLFLGSLHVVVRCLPVCKPLCVGRAARPRSTGCLSRTVRPSVRRLVPMEKGKNNGGEGSIIEFEPIGKKTSGQTTQTKSSSGYCRCLAASSFENWRMRKEGREKERKDAHRWSRSRSWSRAALRAFTRIHCHRRRRRRRRSRFSWRQH